MLAATIFGLAVAVVFLTSLFKNVQFSDRIKNLIAVVVSTVGSAVTLWATKGGSFEGANFFELAVATYGSSQLVYNFIISSNAVGKKVDEVLESVPVIPVQKEEAK